MQSSFCLLGLYTAVPSQRVFTDWRTWDRLLDMLSWFTSLKLWSIKSLLFELVTEDRLHSMQHKVIQLYDFAGYSPFPSFKYIQTTDEWPKNELLQYRDGLVHLTSICIGSNQRILQTITDNGLTKYAATGVCHSQSLTMVWLGEQHLQHATASHWQWSDWVSSIYSMPQPVTDNGLTGWAAFTACHSQSLTMVWLGEQHLQYATVSHWQWSDWVSSIYSMPQSVTDNDLSDQHSERTTSMQKANLCCLVKEAIWGWRNLLRVSDWKAGQPYTVYLDLTTAGSWWEIALS